MLPARRTATAAPPRRMPAVIVPASPTPGGETARARGATSSLRSATPSRTRGRDTAGWCSSAARRGSARPRWWTASAPTSEASACSSATATCWRPHDRSDRSSTSPTGSGPGIDPQRPDDERPAVVRALLDELAAPTWTTIAVVEDAHWADEATLDVLRHVGRRLDGLHAVVVVTYRDDELGPTHPLRALAGDLATAPAVTALDLPPLSRPPSPSSPPTSTTGLADDADLVARVHARPRQPLLRHRGVAAGGSSCRPRSATPSSRAPRGSHRRHARCSTPRRCCPPGPRSSLLLVDRRADEPTSTPASPAGMLRPDRPAPSRSVTSSRGRPSRMRSRRGGGRHARGGRHAAVRRRAAAPRADAPDRTGRTGRPRPRRPPRRAGGRRGPGGDLRDRGRRARRRPRSPPRGGRPVRTRTAPRRPPAPIRHAATLSAFAEQAGLVDRPHEALDAAERALALHRRLGDQRATGDAMRGWPTRPGPPATAGAPATSGSTPSSILEELDPVRSSPLPTPRRRRTRCSHATRPPPCTGGGGPSIWRTRLGARPAHARPQRRRVDPGRRRRPRGRGRPAPQHRPRRAARARQPRWHRLGQPRLRVGRGPGVRRGRGRPRPGHRGRRGARPRRQPQLRHRLAGAGPVRTRRLGRCRGPLATLALDDPTGRRPPASSRSRSGAGCRPTRHR
jgi:hypothetical protein